MTRIKLISSTLVFAALLGWSGMATANSEGFGLGIIAGEPTGVSGKLWMTRTTALDMAVAWSEDGPGDDDIHLQMDHVWHDFDLLSVDEGRLPVYYGIGGRVRLDDGSGDDELGIRFPVGLAYLFEGNRVDLFGEIAPTLDLTNGTNLDMEGGLGLHYFFR